MVSHVSLQHDVFIESDIISEGSVKGVLTCKHYNRSVFCHKILYEAMQRLRFDAFFDQLDEVKQERFCFIHRGIVEHFPERSHQFTENPVTEEIHNQYQDYILESSRRSQTFSFWSMMTGKTVRHHKHLSSVSSASFNTCWEGQWVTQICNKSAFLHCINLLISSIGILLMFIRATREVNWGLYLASFRAMLPWFFACERVSYARYGSAYWLEMTALEQTHPGMLNLYCFADREKRTRGLQL